MPDMNTQQTAIIIGGGLGGLFTGAILAKNGIAVTVVEKNATIGGGLQSFKRFGEVFDTGMHIVGGVQEGCNIRRLMEYIGVYESTLFESADLDCADKIYVASEQKTYEIAAGREGYIRSLVHYFPEEEAHIHQYVEALYRLTDELPLYHLKSSDESLVDHSEEFYMPADAFIAKYLKDKRLQNLVAYINMLYSGEADSTVAFVHAVISVMYLTGPARFVGGSDRLAKLLANVICENGGHILTHQEVTLIQSDQRRIQSIKTTKGLELKADYYISDIHPDILISLLNDPKELPKAFRSRIADLPNASSAFSVFIKLKANSLPYLKSTGFYLQDTACSWHLNEENDNWPLGFLYMTPPEAQPSEYATKMQITIPMAWSYVQPWEESRWSSRPLEYKTWKKVCLQKVLDKMEEMIPNFRTYIQEINAASPLTIRDFYGAKQGSMSGFSKDYRTILATQLSVWTKIQNLYLTGQYVSLHGFCGVPLTAIRTSEAILGNGLILNQLNETL